MKCSKAHKLISEQIDYGLTVEQRKALHAHLEACQSCATLSAEMKQVVEQAGMLEEVVPSANAWPSIRKQLEAPCRRPAEWRRILDFFEPRFRYAALAQVVVCIGIIAIAIYWFVPDDYRDGGKANRTVATTHHFKSTEDNYLEVIDMLNREILVPESQLNHKLITDFKKSLEIIDASIVSIKTAIDRNPADSTVNTYLFACYQRKIEILDQIREGINSRGRM